MKSLLTKILAPFLLVGTAVAGLFAAVKLGWISAETAFWLIPISLTVIFVAVAVFAGIKIGRVWLWPTGTLAVVQLIATLVLLLSEDILESHWDPLKYSVGATVAVLLILLLAWIFSTFRARMLEKKMAGGSGTGADLERIQKDMREALDLLRRAGQGRNAVYQLPWYLVMGRPAAGKTVAIKNSELGLPVKRDWVKGVGGTYTADWFFTNELIFLDTPGGWVTEGATEDGQETWRELMRLLRKYRGRQPLDGLIVVVPADDLIGLSEDELEDQATNVREVVDLIHEQLDFRFPIYVLVTKCDLIEGFVDFFRGLPAKRRHEILGWSNPDPNESDAETIVEKGFGTVQRRLQSYRLEMLGEPKVVKRTQARRLFFFTEEFRGLERPLATFTAALFGGDRYSEPPVFRGFYFSSGTQEGAPLGKAISGVAKAFGIAPPKAEEAAEEGNKRSYFLLELFRELMVGDDGLVGRSAAHWWRRRRNTALGVFAPAAIALGLLLLSGLALGLNKGTYSRIAGNVDEITAELKEIRDKRLLPKVGIQEALEETERLRVYHKQMTGFSPFRTFGMRRPQGLADETLALFAEEFSRTVLRPTLDHALDIVETDNSCVARIQVLRGVVWLRTGPRAGYDDLAGLDRIWGLEGETRKQEERAIGIRKDLQRQFAYLKRSLEGVPQADEILLPGFKIGDAAKAILDYCGEQGATSAAEAYRRWQDECSRLETDAKSVRCHERLNAVLHSAGVDYRTFRKTFEELQEDLEELAAEVPGGGDAREYLAQIPMGEEQTSDCLSNFNEGVVPPLKAYAIKNDFVQACRDAVRGRSRGERAGIRQEILKDQAAAVEQEEADLAGALLNFNTACSSNLQGLRVDLNVIRDVTSTFRRVACYEDDYSRMTSGGVQANTSTPKKVWRPPVDKKEAASPVVRQVDNRPAPKPKPSGSRWFERVKGIQNRYKAGGFAAEFEGWGGELAAIEADYEAGFYSDGQRQDAIGRVRGSVSGYGKGFASSWKARLESLELKPVTGEVPEWLRGLSQNDEFIQYIEEAKAAVIAATGVTEPPYDALSRHLGTTKRLADLDMATYLNMLSTIADEFDELEKDSALWSQYRSAVSANDDSVTLVQAQEWVKQNVDPIAGGALSRLFKKPLKEAEKVLGDMLQRSWEDMIELYRTHLTGVAPFSGNLEDPPIEDADLVEALGLGSGALARVLSATEGKPVDPAAREWLTTASRVASLFFEAGADTPHGLRLALNVDDPEYQFEGKKLKKFEGNYQLGEFFIQLGPAGPSGWEPGTNARLQLEPVPLSGPGASDYAYVEGLIEKRGGLFGKKWEEWDRRMPEVHEGALAPLKLLAAGLTPGGNQLEFQIKIDTKESEKKEKIGTIAIKARLTGDDSAALIELLRNGLPAPPPRIEP